MSKHRSLSRARRRGAPAGPIAAGLKVPQDVLLRQHAQRFYEATRTQPSGPPADYTGVVCARFGEFVHIMQFAVGKADAVILVDVDKATEFADTFVNGVTGPDFAAPFTAAPDGEPGEIEKSEEAPDAGPATPAAEDAQPSDGAPAKAPRRTRSRKSAEPAPTE